MSAALDRIALDRTLARLNAAMAGGCAGGLAIERISEDGVISLRLLGMCGGCSCRALTVGATIRPAVEVIRGVRRLEVTNCGLSRQAEERLAQAFAGRRGGCLARPNDTGVEEVA